MNERLTSLQQLVSLDISRSRVIYYSFIHYFSLSVVFLNSFILGYYLFLGHRPAGHANTTRADSGNHPL